ncbi:MAG: DUF805 domain-containing protein [Pseudomonadota bacterium]
MALPHYFIIALLSPMGRLSQVGFVLLSFLLAMGHLYVFADIKHNDIPLGLNWQTISLYAMLWMQFCVFTRRMKDTGSAGLWFLPLMFLVAFAYACTMDPSLVQFERGNSAMHEIIETWALRMVRALFFAIFIYAVKAQGEEGPNAYGPEFGDKRERVLDDPALEKRMAAQQVTHRFDRTGKASKPAWGNRRRPSGFGRR